MINSMIDFKQLLVFIVLMVSPILMGVTIGCSTLSSSSNVVWMMPQKPEAKPVKFIQKYNGFYIDMESSINLMRHIDELDAYNEKLEVLVKEMKMYYGAK